MMEEQQPVTPADTTRDSTYRHTDSRVASSRILHNMIIGVSIALLLICIETLLWIFNPFHLLGGGVAHSFSALLAIPAHTPLLLLIPLVELIGICILVWVSDKPLALLAYQRDVLQAMEQYRKLYTPLPSLPNLYETAVAYYSDASDSTESELRQNILILELVQRQEVHQLILGEPGSGKTTLLYAWEYMALQDRWAFVRNRNKLPIYVPMTDYSVFLKVDQTERQQRSTHLQNGSVPLADSGSLLDYLLTSELAGMRHLRPFLQQLIRQGRVLFLCDDLNEIDNNDLPTCSSELAWLMGQTANQVVMACREGDYREQPQLVELVDEFSVALALIYPLNQGQVRSFVERYIEESDKHKRHTAGQIMELVDRSRLRYFCTNPMMLFVLLEIIDEMGVARGKQNDTRGYLLREYVAQLMRQEREQPEWSNEALAEKDVILLLGEIATAARLAKIPNAISLNGSGGKNRGTSVAGELANGLQSWLNEHPALQPFAGDDSLNSLHKQYSAEKLAQLLEFAQDAGLVVISHTGVLSFRHELIAEYFVAEYLLATIGSRFIAEPALLPPPLMNAVFGDIGRWCGCVAIWAGLLNDPMELAQPFASLYLQNVEMTAGAESTHSLEALALSLVCAGVAWIPVQAGKAHVVVLPFGVQETLTTSIQNAQARVQLARLMTLCAEEGAREIYAALPLLVAAGMEDLLILLNKTVVTELLFKLLSDTVDDIAYEALDKRLIRVLGRFGAVVVDQAAELSQPAAQRSDRLRSAAINILGATRDERAVEPLLAGLGDANPFIVDRTVHGLIRLGPERTLSENALPHVLAELQNPTPTVGIAILRVLERFLDEQNSAYQVPGLSKQRILEAILSLLNFHYEGPGTRDLTLKATEILVRQSQIAGEDAEAQVITPNYALELLIQNLSSTEDTMVRDVMRMLQEIGPAATTPLIEQLSSQSSETVRMRVIEVLGRLRDRRALPHLLRLLTDPGVMVQQQLALALRALAPESIPGLIDTILHNDSEAVATRAQQILGEIGEEAVGPVLHALVPIVPGRTHLLVHVLEQAHDYSTVPALIDLLEKSQQEQTLALAVIHALGQFPDKQVVLPLLSALRSPTALIYEGAVNALSQLGEMALDELVAALDRKEKTPITSRVQRALLGMRDFPGEQLLDALAHGSDTLAQQILDVFVAKGADAAQVLVAHLLDENTRVRDYVRYALSRMSGQEAVPALLEELNQSEARREVAAEFLLKKPREAIPPLVGLLSEPERGEVAASILLAFGPIMLPSLVSGLDDLSSMAQEHAQQILVALVRESPPVLPRVVQLFNPSLPYRAREALLDVLTNELADISIPPLLAGLEDAHLVGDVSEALLRFVSRHDEQSELVLKELLSSLRKDEQRHGAEIALINIGEQAVPEVGKLITDTDKPVAQAAQDILCSIGTPAFPFIWAAYSDISNPARREAARDIFRKMPTMVIKDELVELLASNEPDHITMALTLLLERIHDEAAQPHTDQEMIPALLEHVQMHGDEVSSLRIISLLLLLGWNTIIEYMAQVLYDFPNHSERLVHAFLLLGEEAQEVLLDMLHNASTPSRLRGEVASVLGMLAEYEDVDEYARTLGEYGLWAGRTINRTGILQPEQLAISLRALGGLLAGGHWDIARLQELQRASKEGSAARELYDVLLGWRNRPRITMLENDLKTEREEHETNIRDLTRQILMQQVHVQELEQALEEARHEHSMRVEELNQIVQEKQELHEGLQQVTQDRQILRDNLDEVRRQNAILSNNLHQLSAQRDALEAQNEQWREYCDELEQEISRLKGSRIR